MSHVILLQMISLAKMLANITIEHNDKDPEVFTSNINLFLHHFHVATLDIAL